MITRRIGQIRGENGIENQVNGEKRNLFLLRAVKIVFLKNIKSSCRSCRHWRGVV